MSAESERDRNDESQESPQVRDRLVFLLDAAMGEKPGVFVNGITSAAFVDLLHIVPKFEGLERLESYTVVQTGFDESEPRFLVRLYAASQDIEAFITMGIERGDWKISAIKVPGIRD